MRNAHQTASITAMGTMGRPNPRRMPAQQWLNASKKSNSAMVCAYRTPKATTSASLLNAPISQGASR